MACAPDLNYGLGALADRAIADSIRIVRRRLGTRLSVRLRLYGRAPIFPLHKLDRCIGVCIGGCIGKHRVLIGFASGLA